MTDTDHGLALTSRQDAGSPASPAAAKQRRRRVWARFTRNRAGNIAMMFGILAVPLFGAVGGAVDFMHVGRTRTVYQNGLDAAVLAAARAKQTGATDSDALALANLHMDGIRAHLPTDGNIAFDVVDRGTAVEGTAHLTLPTKFLAVLGFRSIPFVAASKASFGVGTASGTNVELSLMLDITGSMRGQKIEDLKVAAADLIDIVVADNQDKATSRVGIVPFSNAVHLPTTMFKASTGLEPRSGRQNYDGCVVERIGAEAYTDAAPDVGAFVVPLEHKSRNANCSDGADIMPLTSQKPQLLRLVETLTANGTTAGHIGTAWAWYLLSPNWADVFGPNSAPGPYSDLTERSANGEPKLRKIAVLMTDGEYNTAYSGIDSATQARHVCAEMKKTGIVVYTVGFDLGGNATAIETLKSCASEKTNFYNTSTGAELRSAFNAIALRISPIRLVR